MNRPSISFDQMIEQLEAMRLSERDEIVEMVAHLVLNSQIDSQIVIQAQQIVGGR